MKEFVTFDKVLVALKQGHHAARKDWAANSQYILASHQAGHASGIVMSINGHLGACALHHTDLLADDWEIIPNPIDADRHEQ